MDQVFDISPYGLAREEKQALLLEYLNRLTDFHRERCPLYANILEALEAGSGFESLEKLPFLPVRLFKRFELKSVPDEEVVKRITSSGTSSQSVSVICLDRQTALFQTKTLVKIVQDFIGRKRLPMIILDTSAVIKDRNLFSARGAGILGLSHFGRDHFYFLDEHMEPDWKGLDAFLEKHDGQDILLFGFTYMVWRHFYRELERAAGKVPLDKGVLVHSGGWKKLVEEAVDNFEFKKRLQEASGISRVHNFYGMAEQVGSIYMECEHGHLHAPLFSDILVRSPLDWSVLPNGEEGVIEILSILPHSYPGHVLLTEDLGVILGEDDCPCGRMGRYFRVQGRIPAAEVRGCSDTYAYES